MKWKQISVLRRQYISIEKKQDALLLTLPEIAKENWWLSHNKVTSQAQTTQMKCNYYAVIHQCHYITTWESQLPKFIFTNYYLQLFHSKRLDICWLDYRGGILAKYEWIFSLLDSYWLEIGFDCIAPLNVKRTLHNIIKTNKKWIWTKTQFLLQSWTT